MKGKGGEVELKNVAVGDVWLCSGQSNMEWKLRQLPKDDQGKKVAAKAANPNIRLFTVPNRTAATPQTDFPVNAKAKEGHVAGVHAGDGDRVLGRRVLLRPRPAEGAGRARSG